MSLTDEYVRLCDTPSDIYRHLPLLVDAAHRVNAQHVIELGTRSGVSTVAWLHALEQTGGRLTSVDIDPRPDIGEHPNWTFVQGDDLSPAVLGQLADADVVFIDTSHHYEHTVAELNVYRHLVRAGGLIVCHDTALERPEGAPLRPAFPVLRAVEEFCESEGFDWTNHGPWPGLGIIEVR